jgi:hypothetical protein
MHSRIDTLVSKLHLEERILGKLSISDSVKDFSYDEVYASLEKERIYAQSFLQQIVNNTYPLQGD